MDKINNIQAFNFVVMQIAQDCERHGLSEEKTAAQIKARMPIIKERVAGLVRILEAAQKAANEQE